MKKISRSDVYGLIRQTMYFYHICGMTQSCSWVHMNADLNHFVQLCGTLCCDTLETQQLIILFRLTASNIRMKLFDKSYVSGYSVYAVHPNLMFNTLRPRQNVCHFPDNIFKWIFLNENVWISIKISLKFLPRSPVNNIPALVQIMAWCRSGAKPLSEPMMA